MRTIIAAGSALCCLGLVAGGLAARADAGPSAPSLSAYTGQGAPAFGADDVAHPWLPYVSVPTTVASPTTTLPPATTTTLPPATTTTAAPTTTLPATTLPPTTIPPATTTTLPPATLPPGDQFGSFDTPLSPLAPVSPDSANLAENIVSQYHTYYGTFGIGDQLPIVTVPADQPLVSVASQPGCGSFQADTGDVPIPPSAANRLTGSGDSPLIVWQPSTSTEWEFWQMTYQNGTWSACWGGRIQNVAASGGVFPVPYGLAASGLSYLATTITLADIQSGVIAHPMALQIPVCTTPQVAPATRTDCQDNPGTPAEGMLFRLPASLTMPAGLTPFAQMVFRALQNYGAYITDHAGAVVISAEDPADWAAEGHSGPDPLTASWAGAPQYATMNGIPWGDLQEVLPS